MKKYNFSHKTGTLGDHQSEAIEIIKGDHPVALFDEQGLGKSKMVIAGLIEDISAGLIDCVLIVCKKTLLKMWEEEIEKHSHLKSINLTGGVKERKKYFTFFSHFYTINYEGLIQEEEILSELLQLKNFAIVLDESHRIKNPESKTTNAIMRLRKYSKKNIIITGTPVANKPEDLWSQFYFLDNGKLLGNNFKEFKKEYGIKIGMGKNEINEKGLKQLQEKIKDFSIRRTKDVAAPDLLPKIFCENVVELKGKQKEMYNLLRRELYLEFKNMDGEKITDNSDNILKRLLRLNQIASNPLLIDPGYNETPAKFEILDKLVEEIIKKKEKVIIWTGFVGNIRLLKRRYKKYNAVTIFGQMKIDERNKAKSWFQEDPDYKVLIANPSAAKEGLTLTAANHTIYIDRNFKMDDYLQSQDRIHRLSQTKQCYINLLIARNTVDEYINEILMKKQEIARLVQGDTQNLNYPKELLTKDKLLSILGPLK
jgi:SWI/SNF-related matrix-associated actin-dependent regulator of chromatin subfamily A-like protein 1